MKKILFVLGISLIVLSIFLFLSLILIPFLKLAAANKVILTTIVFVSAEVTFYTGVFFVGKELVMKYKKYLNPFNWFRKKTKEEE